MTSRSLRSSLLNLVLHTYTLLLKFNYLLYYLALLTIRFVRLNKSGVNHANSALQQRFFRLFQFEIYVGNR